MPELPVDQVKKQLQDKLAFAKALFAMALHQKDWSTCDEFAIEITNLEMKLSPEIGMSRVSDLKFELNSLEIYKNKFSPNGEYSPLVNKRITGLHNRLRDEFSLEYEPTSGTKHDVLDTSTRAKVEKELQLLRDRKKEIESRSKTAPNTTRRIAELEKKLSLNPKEPGPTMSKDAAQAVQIQNVEVVRHGEKLLIPQNLEITDAIKLLQQRAAYEEEIATILETFDVFPWDGAIALGRVLKAIFGWVPQRGASIQVDSGVDQKTDVPWGTFTIPGIDGKMVCDAPWKEGRVIFQVQAFVKHKHEHVVKDILRKIADELKVSSIYRGKAIKVRFLDEKGNKLPLPEPKFIDVMGIDENAVAYAKPVQDAIETNLFTPIRRLRELEANGLSIKRSVMLGGIYGTGKTLAAGVAAKLAVQQGMTYIYVARADELTHALAFSKPYQDPAVMLFCEDLDRVMSGERGVKIDDILNTIDGVDSKNDRRMLVFTTNDIDSIEPAMIRPGRLDAVIEVTPPDAEAAWKLVQIYGGKTLSKTIDGHAVGKALDGQIPAVIAEVVRRAKLSELKYTEVGHPVQGLSTNALLDAALTMKHQLELLNRGEPQYMPLAQALAVVGEHLGTVGALDLQEPMPRGLPLLKKTA